MAFSYRIVVTSFFQKDIRRRGRKDQNILAEIEKLKEILASDPHNLSGRFDIKKLKGIKPGEGQLRIRTKHHRLRYDIFGRDVVLYSFRHRREAYR
jgi:mRNA-degrading endonuclease RelE of RelBE toxin-antitoxin system